MEAGLIDERDDLAGADHPVDGVRPAHERLDSGELPAPDVHLRLVVEGEGARLERLLELRAAKPHDRHRSKYGEPRGLPRVGELDARPRYRWDRRGRSCGRPGAHCVASTG
jgi:hypothetical protein